MFSRQKYPRRFYLVKKRFSEKVKMFLLPRLWYASHRIGHFVFLFCGRFTRTFPIFLLYSTANILFFSFTIKNQNIWNGEFCMNKINTVGLQKNWVTKYINYDLKYTPGRYANIFLNYFCKFVVPNIFLYCRFAKFKITKHVWFYG